EQRRSVFEGKSGFQLVDRTGRWNQIPEEDLKDHDTNAEVVLWAPDPQEPKVGARRSLVTVMVIPAGDKAPAAAAREYILAKHRRTYEKTDAGDAYEEGKGPIGNLGDVPGQILQWKVRYTPDLVRFATVGVVAKGKNVIVLYAD